MILPNKLFDALKWICIIGLPAIAVAYSELGAIWTLPYVEQIPKTINVICVLLGSFLGVSNYKYYRNHSLEMPDDEIEVDNSNTGEG